MSFIIRNPTRSQIYPLLRIYFQAICSEPLGFISKAEATRRTRNFGKFEAEDRARALVRDLRLARPKCRNHACRLKSDKF